MSIYLIVSIIGVLVRTQLLPDLISLEMLTFTSVDELFGNLFSILFFTLMIELILYKVTFFTVGLYYQRGSFPAWGAFLYTSFYSASFFILYIYLAHSKIIGILMLMGYISLHVTKLNKHP